MFIHCLNFPESNTCNAPPFLVNIMDIIRYACFCLNKLISFICGFSAKVTRAFHAYKNQWRNLQLEMNTFKERFLFRLRFQVYRCESDIAIFELRKF